VNTYIALFRGINVGGHHKLPMRELVEILTGLDMHNIETYIQTGNVVFESQETNVALLTDSIPAAIRKSHGFAPSVILLSVAEFEKAIAVNPYPDAVSEPKTLHLYFLESEPNNPDLEKLEDLKLNNEEFTLVGKVFYLHAPDGIGRSKLAGQVESALGVAVTARNWRTVEKLMSLANR
jgi:uncharacterized protein (DUF1697 family)